MIKKNLLVAYEGGGYSGCIWEWNFFMFDAKGVYHDIFSSGCAGIYDDAELAISVVDSNRDDLMFFRLDSKEDVINFSKKMAGSLVESVFRWMLENQMEYKLWFECSICEQESSADFPVSYCLSHMGGIVYANTELSCEDCHSSHTCLYCGEFWEDNSGFDLDTGYCDECTKEQLRKDVKNGLYGDCQHV